MCQDERCRHPYTCDCIEQCATRPRRTVDEMIALYARFEGFVGRQLQSADDELLSDSLDPMTRGWLEGYVEEWDAAARWEQRCNRENSEPWPSPEPFPTKGDR